MQCVENIRIISKTANCHHWLYLSAFMVDAWRNLVPFVQIKKHERTHAGVILLGLQLH